MRIWYGIDREHSPCYGLMTLFVESSNPDIDKIVDILSNLNAGINCIYFGAGEIDICDWKFLTDIYKVSNAFKVVVESSKPLSQAVTEYFDFVILRFPVNYVSDNVFIKYRTNYSVGISKATNFKTNSLRDLENGKYSNDIEIYNEENCCA